jgi:hypothetical protein
MTNKPETSPQVGDICEFRQPWAEDTQPPKFGEDIYRATVLEVTKETEDEQGGFVTDKGWVPGDYLVRVLPKGLKHG